MSLTAASSSTRPRASNGVTIGVRTAPSSTCIGVIIAATRAAAETRLTWVR